MDEELSQGIKNGQTIVSSAVKSVMTSAANSVRSNLSAFESVGRYAMNGLAAGIESNGSRAILAAARVARAALAAAKKELDINSPSRKFEEVGMYSDYGIANGFLRNVGVVTGAVKQTASKALNTMSDLMVGQSYNLSPSIVPVMDASRFNMIDDISDSIDFRAQLSDKTKIDSNSNQVMTNQLLQKLINKYDQLTDKLEDIKLYLHLEGIELDGEKVTDAVDEIHSIRDLLDKTGKGE